MGASISKQDVLTHLEDVKDYVGRNAITSWIVENPWKSLGIFLGSKILIWDWLLFRIRNRDLPPGPIGLPVVGSLSIMSDTFYKDLTQLGHKYGEVVYLRMPQRDLVVLNTTNAIKEAYLSRSHDFNDRHHSKLLNSVDFQDEIFSVQYNEEAIAHRKFALHALRTFGFGSKALEKSIQEQSDNLCEFLVQQDGKPVDLDRPLQKATANLICGLLFGEKYTFDDPQLDVVVDQAIGFFNALTEGFQFILFPKIVGKLLNPKVINKMHKQAVSMQQFIEGYLQDHRETFDPDNVRDAVDVYLKERSDLDPKTLRDNFIELFPDAVYSVAMLIRWLILYSLSKPEVSDRLHQEVDEVCGPSRNPSFDDLAKLTYIDAAIKETLRLCNFIPVIASHAPAAETTLFGHRIPKEADIMANVYSVHFDEKLFPEPHEFKPERFLDEKSKLTSTENFLSFGRGPRMCLGEKLAKQEMAMIVANLFQKFHFKFPEDQPAPTTAPAPGVFCTPRNFKVIATPR